MANQFTNPWTLKDDDMLRDSFHVTKKACLMKMLPNRSWNSIMVRGSLLGLNRPTHFSVEEIKIIKKNYYDMPKSQLRSLLNPCRSWASVYTKACELGLKRNQGKFRTGELNGFYGMTLSDKQLIAIRKANTGRRKTEAERILLSIRMTGRFVGSNHPNWKDGITPLNERIRKCSRYKAWRSTIFKRDDFTCVKCGKRGGYIEADHFPIKFSEIISKNNVTNYSKAIACSALWNLKNGRTLCYNCHNPTRGRF